MNQQSDHTDTFLLMFGDFVPVGTAAIADGHDPLTVIRALIGAAYWLTLDHDALAFYRQELHDNLEAAADYEAQNAQEKEETNGNAE